MHDFTSRIDDLKKERQEVLMRIRDAAPRIGDFTFAQDDWRLTLHAAREGLSSRRFSTRCWKPSPRTT